jgi:hypothetical protein
VIPAGSLSGFDVDATADTQVMQVRATFPGGNERQVAWGVEASSRTDVMRLQLSTPDKPEEVTISHLAFTLLAPDAVAGPSIARLEDEHLTLGPVRATVTEIYAVEGAVAVRFTLSPPLVAADLVATAVQGTKLTVEGRTYRDQGLTSSMVLESTVVQSSLLVPDVKRPLTSQSGPANLAAEGITLQYTPDIPISIPPGCG